MDKQRNIKAVEDMLEELMNNSTDFGVGPVSKQDDEYVVEIEGSSPAGEEIVESIFFDGTKDGFIKAFREHAEQFDVDEHAETYVEQRGRGGVPNTIRELLDDAATIRNMLLDEADRLEHLNGNHASMSLAEKAKAAIALTQNTPNGYIYDADTVLTDVIDEIDTEVSGIAEDLINIWLNSSDKVSVAAAFASITGVTFEEYLDRCIAQTTRSDTQ